MAVASSGSYANHSIGSAVFAGLTSVADRQTDRPHYSVAQIGRIYCDAAYAKRLADDEKPPVISNHILVISRRNAFNMHL